MLWVLLAGLIIRLILFTSAPVQEDDHYRFRWDGAVLAHGYNPYAYAPSMILRGASEDIPADLAKLGKESGHILQRVNFPHLRTIYPPVTQAAFALAHLMGGFSLWSWRLVLLAADLAGLLILWRILAQWNLPLNWLALYWLNPILLHETYATCHMEVLLFAPLLGALLLTSRGNVIRSSGLLGLAVGIKLWPALFMPLVLRPHLKRPARIIAAAGVFCLLAALMVLPMVLAGLGADSGLMAYSKGWEMNDAAFLVLLKASKILGSYFSPDHIHMELMARGGCALLVLACLAWLCRRPLRQIQWANAFLAISAALYMLSPTQFPWYALWLLPFSAIRPNWGFSDPGLYPAAILSAPLVRQSGTHRLV